MLTNNIKAVIMISTGGNEIVGGAGGFGIGGFGGIAPIGLIGLNTFLGNGFGGYGTTGVVGSCGLSDLKSELLQQTIANLQSTQIETNAITGAIGELSEQVGAKYDSLNQTLNYGFSNVVNGINGVNTQLLNSKYENQLAMCGQTNTLVATMNAGFQSIKDEMCEAKIADLERQLAVAENGGPIVRAGAFVPLNPCQTDNQMANINQVLVQVGHGLTGLQNAIAAMSGSKKD